jgi:Transposase DDE domain
MSSVAQIEEQVQFIMRERANQLAKETGAIVRVREFDGAGLLQTLVFGFQQHPQASLEQLASLAQLAEADVTDTAVHKHFTEALASFLHRVLQEMTSVVVQAERPVPLRLLKRFQVVMLEDSSTISLPDELVQAWQGCGGNQSHTAAAVKVHVRWELGRGQLEGPKLTDGRTSDHRSPFNEQPPVTGGLYIEDLGYFALERLQQRQQAGAFSLTRYRVGTALYNRQGQRLNVPHVLPKQVGQVKEVPVLVGAHERLPMRLLLVRVPKAVGDERRADLLRDAQRRQQTVSEEVLRLADWTMVLTDAPRQRLRLEEALVLLRERWQIELLYKLWKQYGQVDESRSHHRWRILCELYAKLIGLLLQHWLIVLFRWQDPQRSFVKLAQVVRDTGWTLMEALSGTRSLRRALRTIQRRMRAGCQMNRRRKRPNSAQLLQQGRPEWPLSWCE